MKDDLQPVSTVKAVLPVEDDDSYPTLPWLDITQTNCNCNKYPTCGLIVQNSSNESQYLYDNGGHSDDGGHSDSEIIEHAVNDHNDSSVTDDGQVNMEHLDHEHEEHEEQRYTEKFKLKGTSFHNHFQSALRHFKFCQLSELEPPALSLHFEPVNKRDENAIVVIAEIDGTTDPIGYIPGSRVEKITKAHCSHQITNIQMSEIKRQYNFYVGGFVYVPVVSITKTGRWPPNSNKYRYNCTF